MSGIWAAFSGSDQIKNYTRLHRFIHHRSRTCRTFPVLIKKQSVSWRSWFWSNNIGVYLREAQKLDYPLLLDQWQFTLFVYAKQQDSQPALNLYRLLHSKRDLGSMIQFFSVNLEDHAPSLMHTIPLLIFPLPSSPFSMPSPIQQSSPYPITTLPSSGKL